MLDRLVKDGGTTMAQYEASLNQDIVNIDRYHLPLTAYRIEGWNMQNDDNDALVIYHPRVTSFATQQKIIRELAKAGAGSIVLGCTEIELLISKTDSELPLYASTTIHAHAAVDFALRGDTEPGVPNLA